MQIGDPAPLFSLVVVPLAFRRRKPIRGRSRAALFFYPADRTSG